MIAIRGFLCKWGITILACGESQVFCSWWLGKGPNACRGWGKIFFIKSQLGFRIL